MLHARASRETLANRAPVLWGLLVISFQVGRVPRRYLDPKFKHHAGDLAPSSTTTCVAGGQDSERMSAGFTFYATLFPGGRRTVTREQTGSQLRQTHVPPSGPLLGAAHQPVSLQSTCPCSLRKMFKSPAAYHTGFCFCKNCRRF